MGAQQIGDLDLAQALFPPHKPGRGEAQIACSSRDFYCLHLIDEGDVHNCYRDSEFTARSGNLPLFDMRELCVSFIIDRASLPQLRLDLHLQPGIVREVCEKYGLSASERYMAAPLTDPNLTVGRIAAHLGVSCRDAHKVLWLLSSMLMTMPAVPS